MDVQSGMLRLLAIQAAIGLVMRAVRDCIRLDRVSRMKRQSTREDWGAVNGLSMEARSPCELHPSGSF